MASFDDQASDAEALFLKSALSMRKPDPVVVTSIGSCIYCGESDLDSGLLFCCAECKKDYAYAQRVRRSQFVAV